MRTLLLVSLLVLGCRKHRDETDTDTGPTDTGDPPVWNEAGVLFEAIHEPARWYETVDAWADTQGPSDCPTAYQVDDTNWRIDGGCTTATGIAYTGAIEYLRGPQGERTLFVDWGVTADGAELVHDGEIVVDNTHTLAAEYAVRVNDELVYFYDGLSMAPVDRYFGIFEADQTGSFVYDGGMTAAGSGTFQVSGTVDHGGACDEEPDDGGLDLSGAAAIAYSFDGAIACDGCVPYAGETGSGSICPW